MTALQALSVARELEEGINATMATENPRSIDIITDCLMSFAGCDNARKSQHDNLVALSDADLDHAFKTKGHSSFNRAAIYNFKDNPEVALTFRILQVEFARRALSAAAQFSPEDSSFVRDRINMTALEVAGFNPDVLQKLVTRFPTFNLTRIRTAFTPL